LLIGEGGNRIDSVYRAGKFFRRVAIFISHDIYIHRLPEDEYLDSAGLERYQRVGAGGFVVFSAGRLVIVQLLPFIASY
jgi:hypothetical protein